ncbi:MAG: ATP-binding protein [Methylovirgula sp.]
MGNRISVEIDNDIAEIARVCSLIDSFAQQHRLPEAIVFHMKLAIDELLTNIISYGFQDGGRHKISVSMSLETDDNEGNRLAAEIIDDGVAFDPLSRATPDLSQSVADREIGGLGIHFIRSVMDQVKYHRFEGRNHFQMIKKVPAE